MTAVGSLSLLVPGSFTDDDPYQGLEDTLRLFEYGERLGFDGAWIRQQHRGHRAAAPGRAAPGRAAPGRAAAAAAPAA